MSDHFFGIRLKMERAFEQIVKVEREVSAFLAEGPYRPSITLTRQRGLTRPRYVFDFAILMLVEQACPPIWAVMIGEIVHNLRSALDYSIYSLVVHATGAPPGARDKTQFPILSDPPKCEFHKLPMLKGVSHDAASLIRTFQPFVTDEGEQSPLVHLNKLSNLDKHNMIHLTGASLTDFDFRFPTVEANAYIEHRVRQSGSFGHNTTVAYGRVFSDKPPFGRKPLKVEAELRFDVVFDQRTSPATGDWSVVGTLKQTANRVCTILEALAREIFKTEPRLPGHLQ